MRQSSKKSQKGFRLLFVVKEKICTRIFLSVPPLKSWEKKLQHVRKPPCALLYRHIYAHIYVNIHIDTQKYTYIYKRRVYVTFFPNSPFNLSIYIHTYMHKYMYTNMCKYMYTYIYIHTITWTHTYDVNTYPKSNNINHFVPSLLSSAHTRSQKTQTEQGQPWSPLISCFLFNISLERLWFFFLIFFFEETSRQRRIGATSSRQFTQSLFWSLQKKDTVN